MAGNCRQCPQSSYFNLQNPKSWARNREERLREIFQTASNRRGFVIIWSPSSHLQDISPHGWPAHISAIFELIRATLIPTLGLFECPLSELACQIGLILPGLSNLIPSPWSHIPCPNMPLKKFKYFIVFFFYLQNFHTPYLCPENGSTMIILGAFT